MPKTASNMESIAMAYEIPELSVRLKIKTMKKVFVLCSIFVFVFYGKQSLAQESGKVLLPKISKSYKGECKKGLAHGNGDAKGVDTYSGQFKKGLPQGTGTYVWQNGDYYVGDWHKGLRSGEGEFHIKVNNQDTVYAGIWKHDKYLGKRVVLPTVTYKSSVERYSFKKLSEGCLVSIKIMQNGSVNTSVSQLIIDGDSGNELINGNSFCFENFIVPFKCSVRYYTMNKLRKAQYEVKFDFEITQLGNWELVLNN
ncbi:hypothetical protein [Ancylomarina sp.]|uniref:hypothetical protein n=1 Tax=Ancylomarina sp. TaxID=1970196 RepID=UPI003563E668